MRVARKQDTKRKKGHAVRRPMDRQVPQGAVQPSPYFRWKGAVERALAAVMLAPGLPLIGLLAMLVRLHSRGPGIYRQIRTGKDGRTFTMYKLRTMRCDAESATGPVWAKRRDPRVTFLGRVLRKLHMDELPQLFNVLRGEMALIGPRPERPEIVAVLTDEVEGYTDRLAVLPGVTGLAQINLPPDTTVDDVRRKVILDREYIEQANLWMDVRILLSTFVRLMGFPGAVAIRLLGLRRHIPVLPEKDAATGADIPEEAAATIHAQRISSHPKIAPPPHVAGDFPFHVDPALTNTNIGQAADGETATPTRVVHRPPHKPR